VDVRKKTHCRKQNVDNNKDDNGGEPNDLLAGAEFEKRLPVAGQPHVASAGADDTIMKLWDLANGQLTRPFNQHSKAIL